MKQIKLLKKNGYPEELVNKTTKLYEKFGQNIENRIGKCIVTLKVPFINKSSEILEK